jgi:hypothetical protein
LGVSSITVVGGGGVTLWLRKACALSITLGKIGVGFGFSWRVLNYLKVLSEKFSLFSLKMF